jgi:hypothetical protein
MLWAWDRPEDLRFIDPATTGVAYLAATADILDDGIVRVKMRQEPMQVPSHTFLLPVIRIQSRRGHVRADTPALLEALRRTASIDHTGMVQIDFDARQSEHQLYRDILEQLSSEKVSITALASWCNQGSWLNSQQANEVVPMLFRMGRHVPFDSVHLGLQACATSVGLSTDELWPPHPAQTLNRIYLFSPRPWTNDAYHLARMRIEHWK